MPEELPYTDYQPPGRPLADDPEALLNALPFSRIAYAAGDPDAFNGRIFSPEATALAKAGRLASGQPGASGSAVFREGVHPGDGTRYLVFPRPLPRRALFLLERSEMRRFFPV